MKRKGGSSRLARRSRTACNCHTWIGRQAWLPYLLFLLGTCCSRSRTPCDSSARALRRSLQPWAHSSALSTRRAGLWDPQLLHNSRHSFRFVHFLIIFPVLPGRSILDRTPFLKTDTPTYVLQGTSAHPATCSTIAKTGLLQTGSPAYLLANVCVCVCDVHVRGDDCSAG